MVSFGRNSGSRNVNLEIFAPKLARLDKIVIDRSLANLADAANVVTIGGINASSPYPLETYSAQGPTNGLGGTEFGGQIKPDFAGYAGVSTGKLWPQRLLGHIRFNASCGGRCGFSTECFSRIWASGY